MKYRKFISVAMVGVLFSQSLAPVAYAWQGSGGGTGSGLQQPNRPQPEEPTDPSDRIIPDSYTDLPIPHPGLANASYDIGRDGMWSIPMADFRRSIDFSDAPKDPDTWVPSPPAVGTTFPTVSNATGHWLPWEKPGGGSISSGTSLITPMPSPNRGGGTGVSPNPGSGSGGASGSRGEVSGHMNTNTGMMDFSIPIVSFTGPGDGEVDLALQLKSFTPQWQTQLWTDNYDVRLDVSRTTGQATVTFPSGLSLPFVRSTPAPPVGSLGDGIYQGPMGVRATLENPNGLGYQVRWKNGDVWWFGGHNGQGRNSHLTAITYRKGGSVSVSRSAQLVTVSTGNRSVSINSNAATLPTGTLARITGPNGVTELRRTGSQNHAGPVSLDVVYPGSAKRIRLFYENVQGRTWLPGGGAAVFQNGTRFVAYQDARQAALGNNLRYNYFFDSFGRVTSIVNPQNRSISYDYSIPGQTKITDQNNNVTWDYYANGQYIGGQDESGFTTVVVRNAEHDIVSYRDENGKTWTFGRNSAGDATSSTNPLNHTTSFTYDQWGNVLSKTNPLGQVTSFTYDLRGRLKTGTNAIGQVMFTVDYDLSGQPIAVTDVMGRVSSMSYNDSGDLISTTGLDGLTSTATYNALGLPTFATAPGGKTTSIVYDALSRVSQVTDPTGGVTQFTYDLNDNLTQVRDPLNRISTMTYDSLDQLTTSTNPRGDQEQYTYTVLGELATVRNGRSQIRRYQYTKRGELKFSYLPDGTEEQYSYSGTGHASEYWGTGRQKVKYAYDAEGKISTIDYPTMTDTNFTYDSAGRRIAMTDTSGQTSWFYDALGRVTTLNQAGRVTNYTYNTEGARSSMTQPAGSTSYTYDALGRLTGLTNPFNELTVFGYDSLSRLSSKSVNSGVVEQYAYDNVDRLASMTVRNGSTAAILNTESYTYNVVSEVLTKTENGITTSYGYDAASQLVSESRPGYNASYTFDGNGNRLTKTVNGQVENYTYDAGDKMLTAGSKSYQYDTAGRTVRVTSPGQAPTTMAYDDEDRLITITGTFGTQTYTYNGAGSRVNKNGLFYHRDGVGVTAPLIADASASYTPGISERRAGTTTFNHTGLKNNGLQTGTSQQITGTLRFDAYGMIAGSTGSWQGHFGYGAVGGYQGDETGLMLLGHRYYDASTGRFLTRDPIKDGRNWFTYCENNPINSVDPTGLKSSTAMAIAAGLHRLGCQASSVLLKCYDKCPPWLQARIAAILGSQIDKLRKFLEKAAELDRKIPNPNGCKGNPDHQQAIAEWGRSIQARGGVVTSGGGQVTTQQVQMMNGRTQGPDGIASVNGRVEVVEVGRTLVDGFTPRIRELRKIDRLLEVFDSVDWVGLKFHRPMRN